MVLALKELTFQGSRQENNKLIDEIIADCERARRSLTGVAQWVEYWPANSVQFQSGHMPELPARSPVGDMQEATTQ